MISKINMNNEPLVSVLFQVNRIDGFVKAAVDSIFNQTFNNFEVVVITETHLLEQLRSELKQYDQRLRIIGHNFKGLGIALNIGLLNSKAEFIAKMDADDISLPERLELQVEFLTKNKDIKAVFSRVSTIDKMDNILRKNSPYLSPKTINLVLPFFCCVAHPTVMFRKSYIMSLGGYNNEKIDDYDLWLRILENNPNLHQLAMIDRVLLHYRLHDLQYTANPNYKMLKRWNLILKVKMFLETYKLKYLFAIFIPTWLGRLAFYFYRYFNVQTKKSP